MTTATIPFTNSTNFQGINVPSGIPTQSPWNTNLQPAFNSFSPYSYQNSYINPINSLGGCWNPGAYAPQPIQTLNPFGVPFGGYPTVNNTVSPFGYSNGFSGLNTYPTPFNGQLNGQFGFSGLTPSFSTPFGGQFGFSGLTPSFNTPFGGQFGFGGLTPSFNTPFGGQFGFGGQTPSFNTPFGSQFGFGGPVAAFNTIGGQYTTLSPFNAINSFAPSTPSFGGVSNSTPFQQINPFIASWLSGQPTQNPWFGGYSQNPGAWTNTTPFGINTINPFASNTGVTTSPFAGQPWNSAFGSQNWNNGLVGQPWNNVLGGLNTVSPINGYPYGGVTPNFVPGYQPAQSFGHLVNPAYGYNPAVNCDKTQNLNLNAKAA